MTTSPSSSRKLLPDDERRIAIHEAGHAIIAVKHQIMIDEVTLGPGAEDGEVTVHHDFGDLSLQTADSVSEWQQFYAGGAAGEVVVYDEARPHATKRDEVLHQELADLSGNDSFDRSVQDARELLTASEVAAVADKLQRDRRLDHIGVCRCIGFKPQWER